MQKEILFREWRGVVSYPAVDCHVYDSEALFASAFTSEPQLHSRKGISYIPKTYKNGKHPEDVSRFVRVKTEVDYSTTTF